MIYVKRDKLGYNVPFEYIDKDSKAIDVAESLSKRRVISVDTETTGLDPFLSKILLIQLATDDMGYVIDARKVDNQIFKGVLEDKSILKIFQNVKFDYKMLAEKENIRTKNIFCTMLAEVILLAGKQYSGFSLEALALKYLGIQLDKRTRNEFVGKSDIEFSQRQLIYAANDALILHEIYNQQVQLLIRDGLTKVALLEFGLAPVISEMELKGCQIDVKKWRRFLKTAAGRREKTKSETLKGLSSVVLQKTLTGDAYINLDSPKQLLDALNKLGIDVPDTNSRTLESSEHSEAGVVKSLLEYRKWSKIIQTYGEKLLSKIHKHTGRLHPKINQIRAQTGRTSSEDPNSQNIPTYHPKDPKSLDLRGCFVASKGYKYVGADFSQQELRILAELSNDPSLIDAFLNGQDIHSRTASEVFGVPLDEVESENRHVGKTLNFAIGFGATAFRISDELKCSIDEAQGTIDNYFRSFPRVRQFINKSYLSALDKGYSETISGRRRYYEIPTQDDFDYKKKTRSLKRESCNHPIQGSAADVSKQSLVNLFNMIESTGIDANPVLFIHDEIIVECKEEDVEVCKDILKKAMIDGFTVFFKRVPMVVDVWVSDHWIKG